MSQYYYTVASLPYLSMEIKPELTVEQFLYQCEAEVSENEMQILTNFTLVPGEIQDDTPELVRDWFIYAATFTNELIQSRARKLNRSPAKYIRRTDEVGEAIVAAKHVMNIENPLEAELQQINYFYQFIDARLAGHYFDFDFLLIYKIKLELLLRKFSFTIESGRENFNQIDEHFSSIISSGGIHE